MSGHVERRLKIVFPVFSEYTVYVVLTKDIPEAARKRCIPGDFDYTRGLHVRNGFTSWMFLHPRACSSTVAHECWHAVEGIMKAIGADPESEVIAYHLGYLVGEVSNFMAKRRG